jgi:hypothetical protein
MQIPSSWYAKTGFIIQTSTFARRGFPARSFRRAERVEDGKNCRAYVGNDGKLHWYSLACKCSKQDAKRKYRRLYSER